MPNGDRVLEISRLALLDEGLLDDELDFEWVIGSFGEYSGIRQTCMQQESQLNCI